MQIHFAEVPITDARAHAALTAYFDERSRSFPATGEYRVSWPDPARFTGAAGRFLLALGPEAAVLGCGGVRALDRAPGRTRFEVKHVWVDGSARGNGVGRALLAELRATAERLGADELVLDTNESLRAAGALYRSAGFREIPAYNDNPNATTWYGLSLATGVSAAGDGKLEP